MRCVLNMSWFLLAVMVMCAIMHDVERRVVNTACVVEGRDLVGELCDHAGAEPQLVCIYVLAVLVTSTLI